MDISLDTYRTFYYACQFKNLTKVADILYVTQPAITKQIKKLEESLGKSLIIRTTKGISLTNEGELLYKELKAPMETILQIENTFKNKLDNYELNLKIIAGHHAIKNILLPAMASFNKKHPKIKFEMSSYPSDISIQKLRRNEADLIFCTEDELSEQYNDIVTKPICDIHDILVIAESQKRKYPSKISLEDLSKVPTIAKTEGSAYRAYIDNYYKEMGQKFIPTYELSNYWLIEEYVRLGLGVGLGIKEYMKSDLDNGTVIQIETKEPIPVRKLICAMQKNSAVDSIMREFLREIKL